jgi:hypothetical protein
MKADKEYRQITVAELIALLQRVPLDAKVSAEGCDCDGEAVGISIGNGVVIIRRDPVHTMGSSDNVIVPETTK